MENLLSAILVIQGSFWAISPFLFKKCDDSITNKISKYSLVIIGAIAILMAMLTYYKTINLPIKWYISVILALSIAALIAIGVDYEKCGSKVVLIEQIVETIFVFGLLIFVFYNKANYEKINKQEKRFPWLKNKAIRNR